jgi:uncharacterized membrane protein
LGAGSYATLCLFGFICAVAAITADKFASEIGVLDGMPLSLLGKKKVRKGVSGGVTWLGLTVSVLAAAVIGILLVSVMGRAALVNYYFAITVVTLSGFFGSLVDSLTGYYEEMHIGNKFTSNFLCSVAGAALGILIVVLV